jgi:hypothetical protein
MRAGRAPFEALAVLDDVHPRLALDILLGSVVTHVVGLPVGVSRNGCDGRHRGLPDAARRTSLARVSDIAVKVKTRCEPSEQVLDQFADLW